MKVIFDNISGKCQIDGNIPRGIVCEWREKSGETRVERGELVVARDKIGVQTLYYAQLPTSVIVATDLKDILPHIAYPKINMLNLAQPIRYNFPIDLQQTWIEQIMRVRAGEELTIDQKGIRSRIYWKREHTPTFKGTKEEALAEALRLLRKSVKECVEYSEGPVAVLLSGGIDSTSLAALTKEIQQEVHVISAGYRGNNYTACDERPEARRFAEDKGLIYHEVELDVNDFQLYLDEMMPYLDEPCFDINCMVQYALYKKAAELGFKTILCGLGGDEQFYSYAYHHKVVQALQLRNEFLHLYPVKKHWGEYLRFVLKHPKYLLLPNHPVLMDESVPLAWTYANYKKFAADAVLEGERFADVDVHVSFPQETDINAMYDFMFGPFMTQLCIYMANKMSVANGVEVRYPLLNPKLVEFLDSLPIDMKFDIKQPKRFQKEMMAGIVPDYILYAKKRGFTPPTEFIDAMCRLYTYKRIRASHVFFNSMVADMMIDNLL